MHDTHILDTPSMKGYMKTLTPEQIAAPNYLDWTNEELGAAVRAIAAGMGDAYGLDAKLMACAVGILINRMQACESISSRFTLGGDTLVCQLAPAAPSEGGDIDNTRVAADAPAQTSKRAEGGDA